jgi:ABC-type Zn2+ transport system substrate-binding protein/surface adhesin
VTKEDKLKHKSTVGGLALVGFICLSVPFAQAKMKNVPIQDLTLVQESASKKIAATKDHHHDWHHHHHHHHHDWHHHHHHHHWHHHGVSGGNSGTELPTPKIDVKK